MSLDVLKTQIKNKDIKSLYLFYGPEEYLKKYYMGSIEEIILEKSTRALNKIVMEDKVEVSKIIDNCDTYPVFSQKKVVVVKNSGLFKGSEGSKEDTGKLIDYMKNIPPFTCLIFYETEVDKRLRIYNAIKKEGLIVEFPYQKSYDLAKWVVKVAKANKKEISMETASILVEKSGQEMTEILNEINKLIVYTGEKKVIESEDVREVCNTSIKSKIFDLTDAIVEKDIAKSLKYLDDMITLREPVPIIIYMIARQFRQILEAKILAGSGAGLKEIASKLKVSPYIAGKIQKHAEQFSFQWLNRSIQDIFECDVAIKTGKMKDKTAVELLIAKLVG
ncbi:MAG: DNA polymerase III subunit delta [Firmicutes bacterium]|nr:DNA polymerase III subunit delta [Bacillota bacterium]NSW89321.1 DNA polymerase III subunit delta [Bacillota bacterium]